MAKYQPPDERPTSEHLRELIGKLMSLTNAFEYLLDKVEADEKRANEALADNAAEADHG